MLNIAKVPVLITAVLDNRVKSLQDQSKDHSRYTLLAEIAHRWFVQREPELLLRLPTTWERIRLLNTLFVAPNHPRGVSIRYGV